MGWKPVAAAGAVLGLLAGILGVAGVGAGALIVGILAAIVTFGGLFIVCGDSAGGNGGKGDKYKKLFMNLPIGFAQAKIIEDPVNGTSYQIVDANEIFGEYFKLDVSDYTGKNLKESKKLLHLTVFDGERERCILSGIAKWFAPEDLIGKKIGIVANLAPRPMMKGKYVSEGMIFAADTDVDGGCSIAFFPDNTPAGARIH